MPAATSSRCGWRIWISLHRRPSSTPSAHASTTASSATPIRGRRSSDAVVEGIARDHALAHPARLAGLAARRRDRLQRRGGRSASPATAYSPPPRFTCPSCTHRPISASASSPRRCSKGGLRWNGTGPPPRPHWPTGAPLHAVQPTTRSAAYFARRTQPHCRAGRAPRSDRLSDEIHCGLVLDPATPHIPIAALTNPSPAATVTLMAPPRPGTSWRSTAPSRSSPTPACAPATNAPWPASVPHRTCSALPPPKSPTAIVAPARGADRSPAGQRRPCRRGHRRTARPLPPRPSKPPYLA